MHIQEVEFDQSKYEQNVKDNTFTDEPDGLTPEEIEQLKKDLENGSNN